jgi:hypothetical protein
MAASDRLCIPKKFSEVPAFAPAARHQLFSTEDDVRNQACEPKAEIRFTASLL